MKQSTIGGLETLSVQALRGLLGDGGGLVVDIRPPWQFIDAHIPGSVCLPLCRRWVEWCVALLPTDRSLVLLADNESDVSSALRLSSGVGGLRFSAWLGAGDSPGTAMDAWVCSGGDFDELSTMRVKAMRSLLAGGRDGLEGTVFLDVRDDGERASLSCSGSAHAPLGTVLSAMRDVPMDARVVTVCQSGVRSVIAASVFRRQGIADVRPIEHGLARWWGQYPGDPWWVGDIV